MAVSFQCMTKFTTNKKKKKILNKKGYVCKRFKAISGLPWWLLSENPPAGAGDAGSIPESERFPGGGNGNPLQYFCLRNPMVRDT